MTFQKMSEGAHSITVLAEIIDGRRQQNVKKGVTDLHIFIYA